MPNVPKVRQIVGASGRGGSRLRTYWEYLHTSLWFVPTLMVLSGFPLAEAALRLDAQANPPLTGLTGTLVFSGTATEARQICATLLSGMMTMTSLVFSITIVVLTLAASQFGPRLVRSFMANGFTQFVLGTYLLTIIYCLTVLLRLGGHPAEQTVAMPSISGATGLAAFSMLLLVIFLHSLGRSITAETLISKVGDEVDAQLASLPPHDEVDDSRDPEDDTAQPASAVAVGLTRPGYVQAVGYDTLYDLAVAHDVEIALNFRPGDYLSAGGMALCIAPPERCSQELAERVRTALTVGQRRTPVQDPEFSIRHLVEIAVRALSPGINDPYTAASVVDRLSGSLALAMSRALPQPRIRDDEGRVRLTFAQPTWTSLVGAALSQIRQSGSTKPLVVIHLLDAIARISEHVRDQEQYAALRHQLDAIIRDARRDIPDGTDLADIERRHRHARERLWKCRPTA